MTVILVTLYQKLIFNVYGVSRWSLVLFLGFPGKCFLMSYEHRSTIKENDGSGIWQGKSNIEGCVPYEGRGFRQAKEKHHVTQKYSEGRV